MGREQFDVYRHDVVIKTRLGEKKFQLLPLSGRYYKKLLAIAAKLPKSETDDNLMSEIEEETIGKIHELCFETLKYSEKVEEKDFEQLDLFVSQNLMKIFPEVLKVNLGE